MAVNKVIYGTTVLVDLTRDTVTSDKIFDGIKAHACDGTEITGTAKVTVNNKTLVMPSGLVVFQNNGGE